MAEVVFEDGMKTLRLRSTVEVKNMLSVAMAVQFSVKDKVKDVVTHTYVVQPGRSVWAPLQVRPSSCVPIVMYRPATCRMSLLAR